MLHVLLAINNILNRVILWLATVIIALMVLALSLSALTRYVSGIGYDWFIELPPVLTSWLVFPLLGPLLIKGKHIKVDFLTSIISDKSKIFLRMFVAIVAFMAGVIFCKAGIDATVLYYNLGQKMELEIDVPIWWMYLAFPTGFLILILFSMQMFFEEILNLKKIKIKAD
ncbi:MAG: TRAP transporter small permease subunit [Pseudomonadota bacterium]|jgi:TRAP-type C4-dicarboxylate transport system permease small subunit|nr:TRAP transporter small permease subunit [Pseudomonadota bacterium]MEC8760128.1 TRAP transporter small permease subunit [Pseudomonadota bacterium]